MSARYAAIVVGLMVLLPAVGTFGALRDGVPFLSALATWFLFWAVGVRLFTAGLRQVIRPGDTLRDIFAAPDPGDPLARKLVSEVGFGNLAIGAAALVAPTLPDWRLPVAFAAAVYFGLAGIGHLRGGARGGNEALAMWSDFGAAAVLIAILGAAAVGGL